MYLNILQLNIVGAYCIRLTHKQHLVDGRMQYAPTAMFLLFQILISH